MTYEFKELDYQKTPHGEISLRRRAEPKLDGKLLYEVKLGDEFLMSSLFVEAEEQLAIIGLNSLNQQNLDVVVGGLGLGYTAQAVLQNPRVGSLTVIEVMDAVIDWHRQGLVPLGEALSSDPRCSLVSDDFFELATSSSHGFFPETPDQLVHAVLLDIDHSPSHWLATENSRFYCQQGLESLAVKLHPNGLFGMWSNDPPESNFVKLLESVFISVETQVIDFPNPYTGGESSNSLYFAYTG